MVCAGRMELTKCEFKGGDGSNIAKVKGEYLCQNEATEVFKSSKGKTWKVCKEHYQKMANFLSTVKNALGEKHGIDGYA
jgi:hypothetical protein